MRWVLPIAAAAAAAAAAAGINVACSQCAAATAAGRSSAFTGGVRSEHVASSVPYP